MQPGGEADILSEAFRSRAWSRESPVGDPQRVPHFHDQRRPFGITTGPDGSLWFTEVSGNKVGQINPATHVTTEFSLPTASSAPSGITSGPDGNLWFTEESGNNIGQVVLAAPPTAADLSLSGTAPRSAVMGQDVTYILTVTNNGTAEATNVTLTDTLPAGVTFVSATSGATPVKGVLTLSIGNLAAGASASVTVVLTATAAGTLTNQASVNGNQTDPTPSDDSITQLTTVPAAAGPSVTSVHRFGFHARPTLLVLTFSQPLNPGRAQDPDNYQIVALEDPTGSCASGRRCTTRPPGPWP